MLFDVNEIINSPKFARQMELEEGMRSAGIKRFRENLKKAGENGQSASTMIGTRLVVASHEKMVQAINDFIKEASSGKAGPRHTAIKYLTKLDVDTIANITARTILDELTKKAPLTQTSVYIGVMLENEVNARIFEEKMPRAYEKFHKKAKTETLKRRQWSHLLFPAKLLGVELEEWDRKDCLLLGKALVELFQKATGLIDVNLINSERNGSVYMIEANEKTLEWIEEEAKHLEFLFPVLMPTIVPPRPWTSPTEGGYYSTAIRSQRLVKTNSAEYLEELASRDMPEVYDAINHLQNTAWAVNEQVLEVMETLYQGGAGLAGMPPKDKIPAPQKPLWMPETGKMATEDMTAEQLEEFKAWKARAHQVHVENGKNVRKREQFLRTMGVANKFRDEEEIFFPHQLDWRGRIYPLPLYLHPQGNDMQRGLLTFATCVPITDQIDADWLAIHGAGLFGVDKVSLEERVAWVYEHDDVIRACAADPYTHRWWMLADKGEKPWQFLAFCFEWAGFRDQGYGYESSLPVQMDGTCNGLQNFSAMLLDEVGGAAVNLIPSDKPQDIYQRVADLVSIRIEEDLFSQKPITAKYTDEDGEERELFICTVGDIARGWLGKVNRKVTKRPVMTLAYGAKRFGFVTQVDDDTIKPWRENDPLGFPFIRSGAEGKAIDFGYQAALYMGGLIWESVGEVVVAARKAMDWLQVAASKAAKEGLPINWVTPTGFLVQQAYRVPSLKRVETTFNSTRIRLNYQAGAGKIDSRRQASGISPNWVHSLDASHLMKTINRAAREGIRSFSMIHDSYGTHAGNAAALATFLREEFVLMYGSTDVLKVFKEELEHQMGEELPALPAKGKLDLEDILRSPFFFA